MAPPTILPATPQAPPTAIDPPAQEPAPAPTAPAKPASPAVHPACVNVAPNDPADQCLHNRIEWANRYDAKVWAGYDPLGRNIYGGLSYEPTLAHFGGRLEGAYNPERKFGGGKATVALTLPVNDKVSVQIPATIGFSVDNSSGRPWMTFEGSAGANVRYQPNKYLRISVGGQFEARYRWAPNYDKWEEDKVMTKEAQKDFEAQIQRRLDQFQRDLDAQLALVSDGTRAAFKTAMSSYLGALSSNAMAIALAALTPGTADDAAAQKALDAAGDAALKQLDAQTQQELAGLKAYLGQRIQQLVSDVKGDGEKAWSDYKEKFKLPFDQGGGANVKLSARVDGQIPLVESKEKNGGGVWTLVGVGVTGNIPISFGMENDGALLPTDMDPTRPGVRFSPYLGFRAQIPNTTIGLDLTGNWNPTLSFGGEQGTTFDYKNASVMLQPYFHF